jgi:hypothetical protein
MEKINVTSLNHKKIQKQQIRIAFVGFKFNLKIKLNYFIRHINFPPGRSTRLLLHIADAPCHGRAFQTAAAAARTSDRYPDGDPLGRSVEELLGQLAAKQVFYYFGRINSSTDRMVAAFADLYGWAELTVCDLSRTDLFFDVVVSAASMTVTRSILQSSPVKRGIEKPANAAPFNRVPRSDQIFQIFN